MLVKIPEEKLKELENLFNEKKVDYGDPLSGPNMVHKFLVTHHKNLSILEKEKERFYVIGLDSRKKIKYIDEISCGNLNQTIVGGREVFRTAILIGVESIILAHNHPTGELVPSDQDIMLTKKLCTAGQVIDIPVIDHIIFSEDEYFSFRDAGLL